MDNAVDVGEVIAWATEAAEQVALTDRVNGDRPDADADLQRDRAVATVLLEVVAAQADERGLGPSAMARSTVAAMLGVPGARPMVDVPPFVARAEPAVLGTIHESLHDLVLDDDGRLCDPAGNRKSAGAYYTPAAAVDLLLDHTLDPILDRTADAREVADLRVCDPACGGGNFLDRALVRIADRLVELGLDEVAARTAAARCLTGVDVDPVAVVLARVGLWLRVADRDLPATAFSSQVVLGDALAGQRPGDPIELPGAAFEAGPDDERRIATRWRRAWSERLAHHPDTLERSLATDPRRTLDALALTWQAPKLDGAPSPLDVVTALADGTTPPKPAVHLLDRLAREHRPLHWPLDVPQSVDGFDVVVGNPPYVKSRAHGRVNPGLRRRLTRTRPECRGGQWNLYVPFVALAADLLRAGGRSALLVPNSVVAADFAAPLHQHVADRVALVLDFTRADLFEQAAVHVASLVTTAEPRSGPVTFVVHDHDLRPQHQDKVEPELLDLLPPGYWCLPLLAPFVETSHRDLIELLGRTTTVADVATSRDGCSTTEAYALKPYVRDLAEDDRPGPEGDVVRFANTGTIDPDTFLWGEREAVYLGNRLLEPVVSLAELREHFPKRAAEARRPKVLLAGLSARLEAVADPTGEWLCGKSAVQVLVDDADQAQELAAWLNRPELSDLYRALFGLAGFGGNGMNVAPALVGRLPAPATFSPRPARSTPGTPPPADGPA